MSPSKSVQEQDKSVDEGSEKMRRLHEQLDFGNLAHESRVSYESQLVKQEEKKERPQEVEICNEQTDVEMREINKPMQMRVKENQTPRKEDQCQHQYANQLFPQEQQQRQSQRTNLAPSHQTSTHREPILAEVDAGCCKCTVM